MKTKYYYGKPKEPRRIFSEEPSRLQNFVDCVAFLGTLVGLYVLANMIGG